MNIHACRSHSSSPHHSLFHHSERLLGCSSASQWQNPLPPQYLGGVVEWLMAPVLKTGRAQALVGSNPTPSAFSQGDPLSMRERSIRVRCRVTIPGCPNSPPGRQERSRQQNDVSIAECGMRAADRAKPMRRNHCANYPQDRGERDVG